ncbi:MAG: family 16 glycosylhydrolase [Bacteroidales bacterium]|nr:family 16 glycosylhydrolase [Bacteroidales bacterium]
MNLLDKTRWDNFLPWGNIINPDTDKEIGMNDKLVTYHPDGSVHFGCLNANFNGWKRDKTWNVVNTSTQWSVGAIVSKEEYRTHFGTYHFKFRLPHFRGSWPAIWLIDLHPAPPKGDGMGMPPEIDVFEHFRKDGFLTRFHITHSYQDGPTYENNSVQSKIYWRFWPLDLMDIEMIFTWLPAGMTWTVNGRSVMTVSSDTPNYPVLPMNLIMNAGLGLEWKPKVGKFEDFVIYQATYDQLTGNTESHLAVSR